MKTVGDGVRFTLNSGHGAAPQQLTRCANKRLMHRSKPNREAAIWLNGSI
jgi:hypothetical protein